MEHLEQIESRLWDYIDGLGSPEERSAVERLIRENIEWKARYTEFMDVHQLIQATELEQPSMRFTRNVMEGIAQVQIAPAAKKYINTKVVWGIAGFFIAIIAGFLVYGISQIDWTEGSSGNTFNVDITKVDYSRMFSNQYVNMFMMLNVVLGLMLLERYLSRKNQDYLKQL
jgi:anti-sigma factor RsiW